MSPQREQDVITPQEVTVGHRAGTGFPCSQGRDKHVQQCHRGGFGTGQNFSGQQIGTTWGWEGAAVWGRGADGVPCHPWGHSWGHCPAGLLLPVMFLHSPSPASVSPPKPGVP